MSMTSTFQKIRTHGVVLNTLIKGEGPPVLLVHGFPDDHAIWDKQIDALAEAGFQVIAPDMRGCGESGITGSLKDYAVESLANDLVGLLDALRIERVHLAGHDWGASICWIFSILHPNGVEPRCIVKAHAVHNDEVGLELRQQPEHLQTCVVRSHVV